MVQQRSTHDRLPPGQSPTRKLPVVGEREPGEHAPPETAWRLVVDGLVARPLDLPLADVVAAGTKRRHADIHCVTGWTRLDTTWSGLPLAELLDAAGPLPEARYARFESCSTRRHDTSLDLAQAMADTWVVHGFDGAPLERRHGGPLRSLTPGRYFYKSCKWLARIELLAEDRPGYWERTSAYHPIGDPWSGRQRFSTGSLPPEDLQRLRAATDLSGWRRRTVVGVELRGWDPADRTLAGIGLKGCDLREAQLAGCDLRGVNLSLSDLRGAVLRDADLRDADLEGADLRGCDLRGADLRAALGTATRLRDAATRLDGARVTGLSGLLEDEQAWLDRLDGVLR
ncbi:MAG: molybdopterin-dependent oxidoreductase [Acidimicrobiales bacterium]